MHSFRPPRGNSPPAALPAFLRATHLLGLALGSAFGRLRESGVTAARMFERVEESALLLRMMREAAAILGARWDKVPERARQNVGQFPLHPHTCAQSRPLAAGRLKVGWIHRSGSTTSMRNGCCQFWFEKQPEGCSPGGKRRSTCARTEPS